MTVAVLGGGAVGGLYGGMLAQAGEQVCWLLNSDRDHVQQNGLKVDSVFGDFRISNPDVYANVAQLPECDLLLVGLKTTHVSVLFDTLEKMAHPGLTVLILQNGLGLEQQIAEKFPAVNILGGLCFVCSNKIGPGHISHLDYGAIRLGAFRPEDQPSYEIWSNKLEQAGIPIQKSDNLTRARWEKLVWNMPYNGLSVMLDQSTGPIMAHPSSRALIKDLMLEVIACAQSEGISLDPSLADNMLDNTDKMKDYLPSMLLDYRSQKPLELEYIYRNPLKVAKQAGIKTPKLDMLLQQLEAQTEA
ncbi:putative 2-dehydropantoate 2-reductase [Parendozoicomonas sp. Alg238-R29]|uniref:putative 2-dehydropantoate 2-reductase n=1 Tax=Parendozoicomonas sp. Alg238-R29 TaxID=2993446 RepID=UPI00248D9C2A|nr:putative 2-dehydropantoate 2-reductase [Parendozoicomonas sp. Alg238-R29]